MVEEKKKEEKIVEEAPKGVCGEPHNGPDHSSYCDKDKGHVGVSMHRCHYCGAYYYPKGKKCRGI